MYDIFDTLINHYLHVGTKLKKIYIFTKYKLQKTYKIFTNYLTNIHIIFTRYLQNMYKSQYKLRRNLESNKLQIYVRNALNLSLHIKLTIKLKKA